MKTYAIQVTEMLQKTVLTKADCLEEAIDKVQSAYKRSEIILDSDDFTEHDIGASEFWKDGVFTGDEKQKALYSILD